MYVAQNIKHPERYLISPDTDEELWTTDPKLAYKWKSLPGCKVWCGVQYTTPDLKRNWSCATYGNGYFVALSDGGYQAMSKDGINWTAFNNLPSTQVYADITVANNRFVAVQESNDFVSDDAIVADFI